MLLLLAFVEQLLYPVLYVGEGKYPLNLFVPFVLLHGLLHFRFIEEEYHVQEVLLQGPFAQVLLDDIL